MWGFAEVPGIFCGAACLRPCSTSLTCRLQRPGLRYAHAGLSSSCCVFLPSSRYAGLRGRTAHRPHRAWKEARIRIGRRDLRTSHAAHCAQLQQTPGRWRGYAACLPEHTFPLIAYFASIGRSYFSFGLVELLPRVYR